MTQSPSPSHAQSQPQPDEPCPFTPGQRLTRSLLGYGVLAGPLYVLASLAEAATRPGFDLTRHPWSPLALGRLVQRYVLGSWLAASDPANADYTAKNLHLTLTHFERLKGTR